ncbi:hypothetical protein LY90DRAFT_515738 [Neocallimastix californiae]|uniref:Uncharacterized protein n=1 Tax=Neocallimastix californiae TaxID=1754190 RepID=A0A1Y2AJI9_9FUNG|nr:hypothetical protein LY90DRAFT_515738 [Neocallimastix californiae]|eukprot:ORY22105.1 hypothetical protein LY90DRAFT_515738 [Neocallimastix californiae]
MAVNHAQQYEIERLGKLAWEAQNGAHTLTSKPFPLYIDTKEAKYRTYHLLTLSILTKRAIEDVVMTDAYPEEYERDIPMFNGETGDVESFINRLKRYFGRHQNYYQTEPTAMLYFIEDHIQGLQKSCIRWTKYLSKEMTRNHRD